MHYKKGIIFSCFLVTTFISCVKKDIPIIPIEADCANFSYTSVNTLNWPGIDTTYNTPSFNPNNPNEIIYVRGVLSANKTSIIKRNLLTKSETNIVSDVWRKPDWSSKDWIMFNHADNQVWKIKSNGDSLKLLTSDMQGGNNGVWNPDGNKIAFIKEVGSNKYTIIADANGNHIDTIPYFSFYLTKWSYNGSYIAGQFYDNVNVTYANVSTHQIFNPTSNILDEHSTNMIFGDAITWTTDSQYLIWCNRQGIYKTNISTKATQKIKTACDSKYYTSISVSPDGKKIIAGRTDQKLVGNNLYIKSGLSLMDIDGGNEIKIEVR